MSPRASKGKRRRGKKIGEVGTQAQGQAFQRGYLIKGSQDLGHLAWRVLFKGSIQLYTLAKLMTKKKKNPPNEEQRRYDCGVCTSSPIE